MQGDQLYLDATFRVSIRLTQEQYQELITDGIIKVKQDYILNPDLEGGPALEETIEIKDVQALREFVDDNRQPDDLYLENIEIGE